MLRLKRHHFLNSFGKGAENCELQMFVRKSAPMDYEKKLDNKLCVGICYDERAHHTPGAHSDNEAALSLSIEAR